MCIYDFLEKRKVYNIPEYDIITHSKLLNANGDFVNGISNGYVGDTIWYETKRTANYSILQNAHVLDVIIPNEYLDTIPHVMGYFYGDLIGSVFRINDHRICERYTVNDVRFKRDSETQINDIFIYCHNDDGNYVFSVNSIGKLITIVSEKNHVVIRKKEEIGYSFLASQRYSGNTQKQDDAFVYTDDISFAEDFETPDEMLNMFIYHVVTITKFDNIDSYIDHLNTHQIMEIVNGEFKPTIPKTNNTKQDIANMIIRNIIEVCLVIDYSYDSLVQMNDANPNLWISDHTLIEEDGVYRFKARKYSDGMTLIDSNYVGFNLALLSGSDRNSNMIPLSDFIKIVEAYHDLCHKQ